MPNPAYILDTHVLLWLAYEPEKLSNTAKVAIEENEDAMLSMAISAATLYEVVWLTSQGRLSAKVGSLDFVKEIQHRFKVIPIDGATALSAAQIPSPFLGDPMDRLIVATAIQRNVTLITADRRILDTKLCRLLW
jgi:PIN domain nuclease of toxin-antitoxin system